MKNRFIRILSVLCAIMLLTGVVSAWAVADESAATPTDLAPEKQGEVQEKPAEKETASPETTQKKKPEAKATEKPSKKTKEAKEKPSDGVELIITKTVKLGRPWEGKVSRKKPAILKLDLNKARMVYMLVEGRDVWVSVEKADHRSENAPRTQTDPATNRTIFSWSAEKGSYLITVGPVAPNHLGKAKVTFMDKKAFQAWEAAQEAVKEPEPQPEPEPQGIQDGDYSVSVSFAGGTGKASITSPATLHVSGGNLSVTVRWTSENYDYMIVDGARYDAESTSGGSVFTFPIPALDTIIPIKGDTTAMSVPKLIDYTVSFSLN